MNVIIPLLNAIENARADDIIATRILLDYTITIYRLYLHYCIIYNILAKNNVIYSAMLLSLNKTRKDETKSIYVYNLYIILRTAVDIQFNSPNYISH